MLDGGGVQGRRWAFDDDIDSHGSDELHATVLEGTRLAEPRTALGLGYRLLGDNTRGSSEAKHHAAERPAGR